MLKLISSKMTFALPCSTYLKQEVLPKTDIVLPTAGVVLPRTGVSFYCEVKLGASSDNFPYLRRFSPSQRESRILARDSSRSDNEPGLDPTQPGRDLQATKTRRRAHPGHARHLLTAPKRNFNKEEILIEASIGCAWGSTGSRASPPRAMY